MWTEKLKNGKIKCCERYTDYMTGKEKKVSVTVSDEKRKTLKAAQGVSLDTISRRLGHESDDITRKIYLHVTKKLRERNNAQLEKVQLL